MILSRAFGRQRQNIRWKKVSPVWRDYKPRPRYDVRRHSPRFETLTEATEERWSRIEILRRGNADHRRLGDWLADHADGQPALSMACPLTLRAYRVCAIAEMLRVFENYTDAVFTTVYFTDEVVPFGKLDEIPWEKLKNRLRRQIERAVSPTAIVMGSLEAYADYETKCWWPHGHVIPANCDGKLSGLDKYYENSKESRPFQINELEDRPVQFSYTQKYNAFRVPFDQVGSQRAPRFRLRPPEHNEFMLHIAERTLTDFAFLMNLDWCGSRLEINPKVHAQLLSLRNDV